MLTKEPEEAPMRDAEEVQMDAKPLVMMEAEEGAEAVAHRGVPSGVDRIEASFLDHR